MMRKLQPKLAQIRKETKGNKQAESMRMMELYKEHGVSPFRSIVTLIIQLPIFISLYLTIQIFTTHRNEIDQYTYWFLKGLGPIHDIITQPTHFHEQFLGFIDLTAHAFSSHGINIVLVLLAAIASFAQYLMSRQTAPNTSNKRLRDVMAEAADGKQADQTELNAIVMGKMTKVMPIFTFLIMINLPGALSLYYATSNVVGFFQQKVILREDIEELEEIAEEPIKQTAPAKKPSAVERAKSASEGHVTRITAKDDRKSKRK
jgi:YidC/Oxa1 family membrane protein insertase